MAICFNEDVALGQWKKSVYVFQHPQVITVYLYTFFIGGNVKETACLKERGKKSIFRYFIPNIDTTNSHTMKESNLEIVL